jgi:hypothetical protein
MHTESVGTSYDLVNGSFGQLFQWGYTIKQIVILQYTPATLAIEKILDNHRSVLCSFRISTKVGELDLLSIYWIPKLHKCPYRQRYIAGFAKCSTKPISKLLTYILSAVKTGLHSYYNTSYAMGGVNQMWILKNSNKSFRVHTIKVHLILQYY